MNNGNNDDTDDEEIEWIKKGALFYHNNQKYRVEKLTCSDSELLQCWHTCSEQCIMFCLDDSIRDALKQFAA